MSLDSTPEVVKQVQDVLVNWVYPQRKLLAELQQSDSLTDEELGRALNRLTEAAANTLGVERTSVWRLADDGSGIECLDLYERTPRRHTAGLVLGADRAPTYFRAIATERAIAAHDVREDPRTLELVGGYLQPLGITSMLDAPAFVGGKTKAVFCNEHVGEPRRWQFWEELVASTFADFVALVFEAKGRLSDSAKREARQQELEQLVAERTEALTEAEQSLQALLDATPVALVLTRASDHRVVYANARALALFEVPSTLDFLAYDAGQFWVDPQDRQTFLETVLKKGRIDDVEVRLRSRRGNVFWVRMNAQAVRFRGELTLLGGMVDVTAERQARQSLRDIFAHAPVALTLSDLEKGTGIDGNERAAHLLEMDIEAQRGEPAAKFWVDPTERVRLREIIMEKGRVEGFEAELKTAKGRRFSAEMTAGVVKYEGRAALLVGLTDVSLRKRAEEALRRSEHTLRALLDAVPNPLVVMRMADTAVRYCNRLGADMFELPIAQLIGRRAPDFFVDPGDRANVIRELEQKGHVEGFSAQFRASSGRLFWALMNARFLDLDGDRLLMIGFADLSAQKEVEARLRMLATTDGLTGVFNRRHFFELGEGELDRATRYGHLVSIAMLDLDHFKAVNDELGHAVGDSVLREVVAVLREQTRRADVVGRVGGEEFALLLPETAIVAAPSTVERIRRAVEEHSFDPQGVPHPRKVTVSIGAVERRGLESLSDVLKRADDALYRAKTAGRNRVVIG
jgi:diguanylate cyclase (GGDEF)-like protein/PAS domain S-box-containing protein